jgi:hypothetical protein
LKKDIVLELLRKIRFRRCEKLYGSGVLKKDKVLEF